MLGKTDHVAVQNLMDIYIKRAQSYVTVEPVVIPDIKNTKNITEAQQKLKEGTAILKHINTSDFVVLLDEKGREYTSKQFADFLQKKMISGIKQLVFVIGGPYGFSEAVYSRSNHKIALSQMTFSHQLVRAIFTEQLYRGFAILNNHPYHHE